MTIIEISSLFITIATLFSYLNYRFLRWPSTIGIMFFALVSSLVLLLLAKLGFTSITNTATTIVEQIDFNQTLMDGMLSFLLFAGALHVNFSDLKKRIWFISIASTIGVVLTTVMVGVATYYLFALLGIDIEFIYCLLFGSLIAPTDPIAVMGIVKSAGAPKTLETKIAGESLFNDGVAVVVFITILGIATSPSASSSVADVAKLFAIEALGGVIFGLIIGWICYKLISTVDEYTVEILLTLSVATGGYALAHKLHLSAPLAIVVAGLVIGNHGREYGMSRKTEEHVDTFWELIDEILNAVLFVLIGIELMVISFEASYFIASVFVIPLVLLARMISISLPVILLRNIKHYHPHAIKLLTWGGLRGGISVALALSTPEFSGRDAVLAITYIIVVFSIVVQGMTMGKMVEKYK